MKNIVNIIGGGPAGLALASRLDSSKFEVTIYEKNKSFGRKFLVAGKGGFNLTHSEPIDDFISRYTPPEFLKEALLSFDNVDFRKWLESIGIATFIGSSKRVYPIKGIKPIEVLNKVLENLKKKGVSFQFNHTWVGWNEEHNLQFENGFSLSEGINVFALGGGSWKITGSDGLWLDYFSNQGIKTKSFTASNCSYAVNWSNEILDRFEGKPLKNISISIENKLQKGELVITNYGLEGNAIYAVSPEIRSQFESTAKAIIEIDFKPSLKIEKIRAEIQDSTLNIGETLKKKLKLSAPVIGLLKERLDKKSYINPRILAKTIKSFPIELIGVSPIDEAISTVGGIELEELDKSFQLKALLSNYCLGEMLDWDAPTGGYLLQACFSIGMSLADKLNGELDN